MARNFGLGHLARRRAMAFRAGNAAQGLLQRLYDRFAKRERPSAPRVAVHIEADFIVFHAGDGMPSHEGLSAQNRGVLQ